MKVAKIKKVNENVKKEEDFKEEYSLKTFIKLIVIITIIFVIFYAITIFVVKNRKEDVNSTSGYTILDSEKITFDSLLNRKEKEYYVLATKTNKNKTMNADYNNLYSQYISGTKNTFYTIDLNDAFNKNYVSSESNVVDDLTQLKVNDDTLFYITDGKITSYYIGSKDIIKELSSL